MKIAIVTSTYRKLDGSTSIHLEKTLLSLHKQTHKDYKLFLIGDNYDDNNELKKLSTIIDKDKLYLENLPVAKERSIYSGKKLWCCGGNNANNTGIKKALEEGYDYICLLNHDDIYYENHLSIISECIEKTNAKFITTRCNNIPEISSDNLYNNYRPVRGKLFLVTVCFNYRYYNILPRNMVALYDECIPGDGDMWNRISKFMKDRNEYGICINKNTCRRQMSQFVIKNPDKVK